MNVQPTRVGIAGLGAVAMTHLAAYTELPYVDVVGGADPAPGARALATERFGFPCYASVDELLATQSLDLLCVLSSVNTHRSLVESAARHRVPVLCEKPLAVSVVDALAMDAACRSAGVSLAYGSSYRFLAPIAEARRVVAEGLIGRVDLVVQTFVGGRGPARQEPIGSEHYPAGGPGGTGLGLFDHGIHFLDYIPWLLDSRIEAVFGRGNRSGSPLRPEFAYLTLANDITAHLLCYDGTWSTKLPNEGTWALGEHWEISTGYSPAGVWARDTVEVHVHGSHGALRVSPYAHRLVLSDASGIRDMPVAGRPSPGHFASQLEAVLGALRRGEPAPVPARAGIEALIALEALYESQRTGSVQVIASRV